MVDTLVLALDNATRECGWQDKVQTLRVGGVESFRASKKRQERPMCFESEKVELDIPQQIELFLHLFFPHRHLRVKVLTTIT